MQQAQRGVLTIATGRRVYLDMAIALARSFRWWNNDGDIEFYLATDSVDPLPRDLAFVRRLQFAPGELGTGFSVKLNMQRIAPSLHTLFIDADCLCVGPLAPVFERFSGRAVSVVGGAITEGEWFGDVAATRAHFNLPTLTKFNGGVYYFEQGEVAERVFDHARGLVERYDELGLVRLRDCPNEELLMAISMGLEGCTGLADDGTIHGELFASPKLLEIDVLAGKALLSNPPPGDPQHRRGYPVRETRPVIVHFLGDFTSKWQYRSQARVLRLVSEWRVPQALARTWVAATYQFPMWCLERARSALRPLFRRVVGYRRVRFEERM
ncbi:hypothetical protein [Luteimonas vadosa]|uniref:Glycosyltransferase family 8 protein n=1 Tax=Luteimonas vadosa TaxID=1165507 RepID=A0ABP9DQC4_9GAMM